MVKATRKPARKAPAARGGAVDLLLVALVLVAVWTRTPLGGIGGWLVELAMGEDASPPQLLATFQTAPPPEVIARIEAAVAHPVATLGDGAFPEPFRTAARAVLTGPVPEISRSLVPADASEPAIAVLDLLFQGDPEATLEIYAIGVEQRERAIGRARAAGESQPESYSVHRRYLPAASARAGDAVVLYTMSAGSMLSLAWPIDGAYTVSSPYGMRTHPVLGIKKLHNGVDLKVPEGTPVMAAQSGTVATAKEDRFNGKYIVIDHGYGVRTSYCHMSQLDVKEGDEVERGAGIGLSGNTGRSTGAHLHFTLHVGSDTVDPEKYKPRVEPGV